MSKENRDRQSILKVIYEASERMNLQLPPDRKLEKGEDAQIFGKAGSLDSLGLVNFVVCVEEGLQDRLCLSLALASERAFSRSSSPFSTMGTLADYIAELIADLDKTP